MDLKYILSPSKILPLYIERKARQARLLPPASVEFHPTSNCNYRCMHCSYGKRNAAHRKLAKPVLESAINDLLHVYKPGGIYVSGGGEPTTYPQWQTLLDAFSDSGIETALVTNGALLAESHAETLSKLNYIAISVYSTRRDEYEEITRGGAFERQFSVPWLLRNTPVIKGARCVISRSNVSSVREVYRKAMESGFDYVIFIPAIDYEGRGVGFGDEEKRLLLSAGWNPDEFDESRTNLKKILTNAAAYYVEKGTARSPVCHCVNLRTNAFINYDGGVYLCQPHIGKKKFCIGNLTEQPLRDIWNGSRHEAAIKTLQKEWINGNCKNCRCIAYNNCIESYERAPANTPIEFVKDVFL